MHFPAETGKTPDSLLSKPKPRICARILPLAALLIFCAGFLPASAQDAVAAKPREAQEKAEKPALIKGLSLAIHSDRQLFFSGRPVFVNLHLGISDSSSAEGRKLFSQSFDLLQALTLTGPGGQKLLPREKREPSRPGERFFRLELSRLYDLSGEGDYKLEFRLPLSPDGKLYLEAQPLEFSRTPRDLVRLALSPAKDIAEKSADGQPGRWVSVTLDTALARDVRVTGVKLHLQASPLNDPGKIPPEQRVVVSSAAELSPLEGEGLLLQSGAEAQPVDLRGFFWERKFLHIYPQRNLEEVVDKERYSLKAAVSGQYGGKRFLAESAELEVELP